MADPLVAVFHSRDLDGLLSQREADAVSDWLHNTSTPYHVMRDHPHHGAYILAGMFGIRDVCGSDVMVNVFKDILIGSSGRWNRKELDQVSDTDSGDIRSILNRP